MSLESNIGCLGALFEIFGIDLNTDEKTSLPYRLRDDFPSMAEVIFYRVLHAAIRDDITVFTKVNLADIF